MFLVNKQKHASKWRQSNFLVSNEKLPHDEIVGGVFDLGIV